MNTVITLIISFILLNVCLGVKMLPLDLAVALALFVVWAVTRPKKPKPPVPTFADVWASIRKAQNTLDQGYALIHGGTSE